MKKHKGYLNWEWPNGSMVGDPKDMKKPKEKTYWVAKDVYGAIILSSINYLKKDAKIWLCNSLGRPMKGKIVKVKLVEV